MDELNPMSDESPFDIAFQIQIDDTATLPLERLKRAISWVLDRHEQPVGTGVSVVITDDESIREMNRAYRGVDKPTDVLSFAADPLPVPDPDEQYVGDLILAQPYIQRQAETEGHDWQDEMTLAVIHGTLHLLGYDHDTPDHQRAMWAVQAEALAAMRVAITVPLFEFEDEDDGTSPDVDAGED